MKAKSIENAWTGLSTQINGSKCPTSWKDVFVLNDQSGRCHIIPAGSVQLSEGGSKGWYFRTLCGDFKPVSNDPVLELIMDGEREFAVVVVDYNIEISNPTDR